MQGNTSSSVTRLKSSRSVVKVNTNTQENSEGEKLYSERSITYTVGNRFLSLNITKLRDSTTARVNGVSINLAEITGKNSCAYLFVTVIRDNRYGVLCSIDTKLSGSYEVRKKNYSVPPLADTELIYYRCRETGAGGYFTLEKRKESDVVERVKYTHAFLVGDETLCVKVKITKDRSLGLRVEEEGPMTLTQDYSEHVFRKVIEKMESEMISRGSSLFTNVKTNQNALKGNSRECDLGNNNNRKTVSKRIRSLELPDESQSESENDNDSHNSDDY